MKYIALIIAAFALASCGGPGTVETAPVSTPAWSGTPNPLDLPGGEDPNFGLWRYNDPHMRMFGSDFGH